MKYRTFRDINYFKSFFKYIYTIDAADAEEYDFIYVEGIHSKIDLHIHELKNDIVFAGSDKGRGDFIKQLYKSLVRAGIKCNFTVAGMEDPPEGINTNWLPYAEVLDKELTSKCILEVCVGEQCANTLRSLEAVMYDKALITNNKLIKQSKYYNPQTMLVFDTIEDVLEWDVPKETFSYIYQGDYSPINLLNDIVSRNSQI